MSDALFKGKKVAEEVLKYSPNKVLLYLQDIAIMSILEK